MFEKADRSGPLRDLRVIEIGSLVADPFAARTLADFGADVTEIALPDGTRRP